MPRAFAASTAGDWLPSSTTSAGPASATGASWSAWIVIVTGWGAFFSWYTSFGGPLTDEEIEAIDWVNFAYQLMSGEQDPALLHKANEVPIDQLALVEMLCIGAHAVRRADMQS